MVENKILEFDLKRSNGIFGFSIDGGETKPIGIYINKIEENSEADIAGLRTYDLILSANERDFTKVLIQQAVLYLKSLDSLNLKVKRLVQETNVQTQTYRLINLSRPKKRFNFGIRLHFIMEENKQNKLIVKKIEKDSLASISNLKTGDRILALNNFLICSLQDFYKAVQMFKCELTLQLVVIRCKNENNLIKNPFNQRIISMGCQTLSDSIRLKQINEKKKIFPKNFNFHLNDFLNDNFSF